MSSIHGAVVVVTGASSGMGAAIALGAARGGAELVITGRDSARLDNVASEAATYGHPVHTVPADLRTAEGIQSLEKEIAGRFKQVDGLVHSAGVFRPRAFEETTVGDLEEQWAVNVRAPFALTQRLLPYMVSGSAIVFITSIAGHVGFPGSTAYCATKGAVELLSKSLAVELAPTGIRVNAVAPGNVRTAMNDLLFSSPGYMAEMLASTPAGRIGQTDDIVGPVMFLLSQEARYMYGASLIVDGGWTAQ